MTFSEVYASVLSPFVKNYVAAKNEKGRKAVVSNAADAVRKSRNLFEDKGDFLPKSLEPVCLLFFSLTLSTDSHHDFRLSFAISNVVLRRKQMQLVAKM
jgi:hypothetical protein